MSNLKILVSVLNFNSKDEVIVTLESLSRMRGVKYDLELVDNASTNGCLEYILPRVKHLDVNVVRHNYNSGYAGGMNLILRRGFESNYDYILICNSDIEVESDAIQKMLFAAELHPDAAVVGAVEKCFFSGEIRAIGGGPFSLWFGRGNWVRVAVYLSISTSATYRCARGALVLFTKKAHHHNIYMDEELFMYHEDADLGYKIESEGLSAYVAHEVIFLHKSESKFLDLRAGYYQQRNRVYMVSKYGSFYHYIFLIFYLALIELPIKLIVRSLQGKLGYAWSCVQGFVDGVRGVTGRWQHH